MAPFERTEDVVVRLADGPCAGSYATVKAFGDECWHRLGRSEQVFLRYFKNLFAPAEYVWSGEALTEPELVARMHTEQAESGAVFGRSHGA